MAIETGKPFSAQLQFNLVSYERGENLLFENLSFDLVPGQILWIQGDNGIGKTSILRLAAGLTPPLSGQIEYFDRGDKTSPEELIAFQSHHDALEPSFTVREELEFWIDIYEPQLDIETYLQRVDLSNRAFVKTNDLSAGQKRRLSLAKLMISDRPIWLMDEPKAAMDKAGQNLVDQLMHAHIQNGGAILAATHNKAVSLGKNTRRLVLENLS